MGGFPWSCVALAAGMLELHSRCSYGMALDTLPDAASPLLSFGDLVKAHEYLVRHTLPCVTSTVAVLD